MLIIYIAKLIQARTKSYQVQYVNQCYNNNEGEF